MLRMLGLKPLALWVLPWGLLAGLLITLMLSAAQENWQTVPSDCAQATSSPYNLYSLSAQGGCTTLDRGYPVPFLSTEPFMEADPGGPARNAIVGAIPVIDPRHLAADWLLWSLVSGLVLYFLSRPRGVSPERATPAGRR